ncbi:hypothetical protein AAE478_001231 [Parahypoxylon ruwenzoriense]
MQATTSEIVKAAAARMTAEKGPISSLPLECFLSIAASSGPSTAINLALTGPAAYLAISGNERYLVDAMVYGAIGVNALPLALAQFHIGRPGRQNVRSLSMCKARQLVSFHAAVTYYADVLARRAMSRGPRPTNQDTITGEDVPACLKQVSARESDRFIRALYILQLVSRPEWQGVWTNSPPWLNQQVRCIQEILQDHLLEVIENDPGNAKKRRPWVPSQSLLAQFVVNTSLQVIWDQECQGSIVRAVMAYQKEATPSTIKQAWFSDDDKPWLKRDAGGRVSLNVDHVVTAWLEDDSGPRDSWLHTLLQMQVDEDTVFQPGIGCQFRCDRCMTIWGFVFWDREKLVWHSYNTMPTFEQMTGAASDVFVSPFEFRKWSRGRKLGYCDHDADY